MPKYRNKETGEEISVSHTRTYLDPKRTINVETGEEIDESVWEFVEPPTTSYTNVVAKKAVNDGRGTR